MQIERQSVPYPLAPVSPNTGIDTKSRLRKASAENVDSTTEKGGHLRTFAGRTMSRRFGGRPKENQKAAVDPLKSINKIINDCEDAVQHYVTDSGPVPLSRIAARSHSFKNGPSGTAISNPKCLNRMGSSKGARLFEADSENDPKKRASMCCVPPTRKKSVKITGEIPGVTNALLKKLYEAKCADLQRQVTVEQERRFIEFCTKVIKNRKFALKEVPCFLRIFCNARTHKKLKN